MNRFHTPGVAIARATVALFALAAVVGLSAHAQVAHTVPRGEVSGVDVQIDGALTAYRGHPMRFGFSTFEVLGIDRLRRVRGATVRVFASYLRERAVAEVTTDVYGRALATIDIPDDVRSSFAVVLEVRTPSRVTRRFEFQVPVQDSRALALSLAPTAVYPGSPLHVTGRLTDTRTATAIAGTSVLVEVRGPRGPIGTALRIVTDANGAFARDLTLERDAAVGSVTASARVAGDYPLTATATARVTPRDAPTLLVSIAPSERIVRPRGFVDLDVVVRRPDGRPVPGATVSTTVRIEERSTGTTDARGHARLRYQTQARTTGLVDERVDVVVERAGIGSARAATTVRVTGDLYAGRISFEGGRFAESFGGKVYVRVVGVDGRAAAAGIPVVLTGPRVQGGEVHAATDEFGVATADLTIVAARTGDDEATDSCGGTVATEISASIGASSDGARLTRCLPIDPDGVLRVRTNRSSIRGGESLRVHVDRAPSVARAPVVAELLDTRAGTLGVVLAAATLAADAADVELLVPTDVTGRLWVRTRALFGTEAQELRGASTVVYASPNAPFRLEGRFDRERGALELTLEGAPSEGVTLRALALPYEIALAAERGYDPGQQFVGPSPVTADTYPRGESWLIAALADEVPFDELAASALVDGALTPQPGPESPEMAGRLRDPYRARARFVQGRLALLFRALETFVDENVPGDADTVAHDVRGRREFNDAVLSAVASQGTLGPDGATGLGGEPITIAQLRTIDPGFSYDAVARRVTRKRLFRLLLELRQFVNENDFDLAWARPGDPRVWIERMVTEGGGHFGPLSARNMVDAWGRPFQLVETARPRFSLLQPVVGFELVSAGPDGRYGNGDDVVDPTARVLSASGTYASAVSEDALVARLRGVELSRASLGLVADLFGVYAAGVPYAGDAGTQRGASDASAAFPSIVELDPDPLAIRRFSATTPSVVVGPVAARGGNASIPLELGTEPRSWGVFIYATAPTGEVISTLVRATTGTSALTHGELPSRVHTGEPLSVDLALTNVGGTARTYTLRPSACAGATLEIPSSVRVGAEESAPIRATLRAADVGRCAVRVDVLEGERILASLERSVEVTSGLHPQRRRASALAAGDTASLDLAAPADASRVSGRVTVVDPSAIVELPELASLHASNPSLIAWARVTAGRGFDDALRDEVLRAFSNPSQRTSSLSRALAVVALSARIDDEPARVLRDRLMGQLDLASSESVVASDGGSAHRRLVAAVVAALALSGVPDPDGAGGVDPIGRLFLRLLPELRASVRADVASPTELAFPAAALLLADSHDGHGRALFERAFASVEHVGSALRLVAAPSREPIEGTAATLALAIAARELGRDSDALALIRAGVHDLASISRGGEDAPFWLAALGVYGTLANDSVAEVEVTIAGRTERARLDLGRVSFDVPLTPGGRTSIRVRALGGAVVLAESEVAYDAPFVASDAGPLHVSLEGDPGRAYGVAALELSVASSEAVFDPIVELELPASVEFDAALERALLASSAVRTVEARAGGFIRLALAPMGSAARVQIPLPIVFRATGTLTGLAASAYPATASYRRSLMAPRSIQLAAE